MAHTDDIQKMDRISIVAKLGTPLKLILQEVSALTSKVDVWTIVPTSGSAVCKYHVGTGKPNKYEVRYQQGNIGNLVHELIHVAVNEAYEQDFVNYPNPTAKTSPKMKDRTYDAAGHCTNEFDRQTAFMNAGENGKIADSLTELTRWANTSTELTLQQRSDITAKFNYGMQWPMKEYDTVITQVLVWLHEWGYPRLVPDTDKKPIVNGFFEELEKAVKAAYDRRKTG
ncbi:MAG: hypothetical protein HON04_14320 [Planctomicrobium sp.]|nr:hypothetical protein [Planctomicrobium sp.]